jgi:hypothetical protein
VFRLVCSCERGLAVRILGGPVFLCGDRKASNAVEKREKENYNNNNENELLCCVAVWCDFELMLERSCFQIANFAALQLPC